MHLEAKATSSSQAMSSSSLHLTLLLLLPIACCGSALDANQPSLAIIREPLSLPQQLRIWQCRQSCYHQTLRQPATPGLCHSRPDCFMCHDYCRVLVVAEWSLARSMCADRIFCSQGCRTACAFHRLRTDKLSPFVNALHKT